MATVVLGALIPVELRPALRELLVADRDGAREQAAAFDAAVDHLDVHGRWYMHDDDVDCAILVWDQVRHSYKADSLADAQCLIAAMEERPVDEVRTEHLAEAERARRAELWYAEVQRLRRHWFWRWVNRVPDVKTGGWRLVNRIAERV